jgi:tRNA threonylcarbamoyladenosine biosynthesis protein TsaE
MNFTYHSRSAADTHALGRALGRVAEPGLVVGLVGRLGAGKTVLVRGLADGLAMADLSQVCSPTFMLIHEYDARLPIFHFDSYRLSNEQAFAELGVWEYFDGEGVCVVEWSDRVASSLPPDRIELLFEDVDESSRRIEVLLRGTRWRALFKGWAESIEPGRDPTPL